jgi:xylan 1,4-beta-xylosidase
VRLENGGTWAVFLGCRPYEDGYYNTGRETFALPVQWRGGWPEILPKGEALPESVLGPLPEQTSEGSDSNTGNFTWRDDFSKASLSPQWNFLRVPVEAWWSLSAVPGSLSLRPRNVSLGSLHNPSFIGRRQQHARFTAIAELRFPESEGYSAGLTAFHNETHNFFLGVRRKGADGEVFLEELDGGEPNASPSIVARSPLPYSDKVELEVEGKGGRYSFRFRSGSELWNELAEADGRILSTKVAGGFMGTYLGMYTRLESGAGK